MEKYRVLRNLGDGSFGTVSKAINKSTKQLVAIKHLKSKFQPRSNFSCNPEVSILNQLRHPNIIALIEVIQDQTDVFLVFEYMECSLLDLPQNPSSHPFLISFIRQCFEALSYLHNSGYMHRDVKPENILISDQTCKISDFGLAKRVNTGRDTDYVSTRWYRAPEVLLRSHSYTPAVDNFAMGCIIAEIYMSRPLFPGQNEDDQLDKITEVLGTPSWEEGKSLAKRIGYKFRQTSGVILGEYLEAPRQAVRLIELLIKWDPTERYTAAQALRHPYLSGVKSSSVRNYD